jgi:hypothetical protein
MSTSRTCVALRSVIAAPPVVAAAAKGKNLFVITATVLGTSRGSASDSHRYLHWMVDTQPSVKPV